MTPLTMKLFYCLIILCVIGGLWCLAVLINRLNVRKHNRSGDLDADLIIFVEPIRWLFIIWGFAWFCRGLRLANGNQHVRLFRWCSPWGSLLVVPDLVWHRRSLRKANKL